MIIIVMIIIMIMIIMMMIIMMMIIMMLAGTRGGVGDHFAWSGRVRAWVGSGRFGSLCGGVGSGSGSGQCRVGSSIGNTRSPQNQVRIDREDIDRLKVAHDDHHRDDYHHDDDHHDDDPHADDHHDVCGDGGVVRS